MPNYARLAGADSDRSIPTTDTQLLRNRDATSSPGPFDGQVAAFAELGAEHFFVTTNTGYVPAIPSLQIPHALFLRSDLRWGTDDPTRWPQQWTAHYCHLPAIAKPGTRSDISVMWWNPTRSDFVVGSSVTRGLGKLHYKCMAKLLEPINSLVNLCKELRDREHARNARVSPLFGVLINNILSWIEQLQSLPTTYNKMVFAIASVQSAFLELDALYRYITVFKPRIDNFMTAAPPTTPVAECVGAFTVVPAVAQQLWAARLPFWFLRPTYVFDDAVNILKVVPLTEPCFIPSDALDGHPGIVYSGNSTVDKIDAIHKAALHTPWYRDPFERHDAPAALPAAQPASPATTKSPRAVAGSSHKVATGSRTNASGSNSQRRTHINLTADASNGSKPAKSMPAEDRSKQVTKPERDKFAYLAADGMPPAIPSWAQALAQVDRSVPPASTVDRRYVLPEPALFVNTIPERRRKFLHHWNLVVDGIIYVISQGHDPLFSGQEWRDVLEGRVTQRGDPRSRAYKRSTSFQERMRPALEASGVSSLEGFPVPSDSIPDFTREQSCEIIWQVAEVSFRLEFAALDRRASGKDRFGDVRACFAGHMLLGVPVEMGQRGWAATSIEERHRYAMRAANLMLDWTTQCSRPHIIRRVAEHFSWSAAAMEELQTAVCRYYTQAFWEYFGRAAVVPLRLDHDPQKKDVVDT
ncbi:hypothetical protein C8R47DRAFT_990141 [Mycena vitilis]|nr:hypothetical protein C8R47DRAFT_990141 [Mycena vitilis]